MTGKRRDKWATDFRDAVGRTVSSEIYLMSKLVRGRMRYGKPC